MKMLAIAALAALIASPALAGDMAAGHDAAAHGDFVTTADTDKNGSVSMDEAKAAADTKFGTEEAFKAADTNTDGSLSAEEVAAVK